MSCKRIVFVIFLLVFSCSSNAQTADDIIQKYVQFIGGADAWHSVHTLVTEGTYDYGGMVFPFTAYQKAPNKYRYLVPSKGKYFAQSYNGKSGWKIDAFKGEAKKTILTGKEATALANEADVELENAFINYRKKGSQAEYTGEDSVEGNPCYKVQLMRQNGDSALYFFSTKSGALLKKTAKAKNEELDNNTIDTYYSNYKKINGIVLPFSAITKLGEQTILTVVINKISVNIPVADKDFEP